jgi:hypothetical protein
MRAIGGRHERQQTMEQRIEFGALEGERGHELAVDVGTDVRPFGPRETRFDLVEVGLPALEVRVPALRGVEPTRGTSDRVLVRFFFPRKRGPHRAHVGIVTRAGGVRGIAAALPSNALHRASSRSSSMPICADQSQREPGGSGPARYVREGAMAEVSVMRTRRARLTTGWHASCPGPFDGPARDVMRYPS